MDKTLDFGIKEFNKILKLISALSKKIQKIKKMWIEESKLPFMWWGIYDCSEGRTKDVNMFKMHCINSQRNNELNETHF